MQVGVMKDKFIMYVLIFSEGVVYQCFFIEIFVNNFL